MHVAENTVITITEVATTINNIFDFMRFRSSFMKFCHFIYEVVKFYPM